MLHVCHISKNFITIFSEKSFRASLSFPFARMFLSQVLSFFLKSILMEANAQV